MPLPESFESALLEIAAGRESSFQLDFEIERNDDGRLWLRGAVTFTAFRSRRRHQLEHASFSCDELLEYLLEFFESEMPLGGARDRPVQLSIGLLADVGGTPWPAAGLRLGVEIFLTAPVSLILGADLTGPQWGRLGGTTTTVGVAVLAGEALLCGQAAVSEIVAIDLCGGAVVGANLAAFRFSSGSESTTSPLVSADARLVIGFDLPRVFMGLLEITRFFVVADLLVPVMRSAVAVGGLGVSLHVNELAGGRFGVGLAWRL